MRSNSHDGDDDRNQALFSTSEFGEPVSKSGSSVHQNNKAYSLQEAYIKVGGMGKCPRKCSRNPYQQLYSYIIMPNCCLM